MIGVDAVTGKALAGIDHLRQSIRDILCTPIGTRVMRRNYGSRLFRLVDSPMTPELQVEIFAATVDALAEWEPRLLVTSVTAETSDPASGRMLVAVEGQYLVDGRPVKLEGIQI
jgi:uncharacterized protein